MGPSQACDVHGQLCHAGGQVEENLKEIECVEEASGGFHGTQLAKDVDVLAKCKTLDSYPQYQSRVPVTYLDLKTPTYR